MQNNSEESSISFNKKLSSNNQPSQEFFNLVEEFAKSFIKPKQIYQKIVEKGRQEGFTDRDIDMILTSYLKGRVHDNTLTNYRNEFLTLPDYHKQKIHKFVNLKNLEQSSSTAIEQQQQEPQEQQQQQEELLWIIPARQAPAFKFDIAKLRMDLVKIQGIIINPKTKEVRLGNG